MKDADETEPIRPATVHRAYGRGAAAYDGFVGSIRGYHDHLRMSTTRMGLTGGSDLRLLDIGCGTGASTEALLDAAPGAEVVAVDASADMLAVARRKNWPPRVRFVHARLETLAEAGVQGPFDGVFAAYLVSNLPDAEIGLRRLLSLLKAGAPLAVHDYAVADRISSRMRWSMWSWMYLIPLARMRWTGAADLQRYRTHQVRTDGVESVTHRMQRAGFEDVRVQTVSGWQQHLVYTFLGKRPDEPDVVAQRQEARRAAADESATRGSADPGEEAPTADDAGGPEDPGYAAGAGAGDSADTGDTGGTAKPGKDWKRGETGTTGPDGSGSGGTAAHESAGLDDMETPPHGQRAVRR